MADVFLSYAREDAARAEQIARGLENAGLDVFWDNEIPPGQTWADYIEQKLAQCKALIVLWSAHSVGSQWVREEARLGRDKSVLIPVMIDSVQPPFGFGEVQAANLSNWNGAPDDPNWRRFVDAVSNFAKGAAPRPSAQAMPTPPRTAPQPTYSAPAAQQRKGVPVWAWIAGGVAAVVVLLVAIGAILSGAKPTEFAAGQTPQTAAGAPAPAQQPPATTAEDPQAVILAQLQQAQALAAQQGFQLIGQPYSGSLAQGQSWNVPAQFYAGYDYRVLGVCDRDCADLDLVLFDSAGRQVSQDTTTTSQPVVGVQPSYNDNFTIQVQMYNCSVAPCYYALALYGRPLQ